MTRYTDTVGDNNAQRFLSEFYLSVLHGEVIICACRAFVRDIAGVLSSASGIAPNQNPLRLPLQLLIPE